MTDHLAIDGLRVARGHRVVLTDVTMELPRGRVTALLGANGAGKSTFVLAIAGVLRPLAGSIRLDGVDYVGAPPHKIRAAGVCAVPEGHRVLTNLTVRENLHAAGSMLGRRQATEAVTGALDFFPELRDRLAQRAGTLSGGQQQMLAFGQALVSRPRFLLADELSLGLAPVIVNRLVRAVAEIAASGTGVLLIEQFTHIALQLATDAHLMERGSIRWSGTAAELEANPGLLHASYLAGDFDLASAAAPKSTR